MKHPTLMSSGPRLHLIDRVNLIPGPNRYDVRHVQGMKSVFELFTAVSVENYILEVRTGGEEHVKGQSVRLGCDALAF